MNAVITALARHGAAYPLRCAYADGERTVDYRSLNRAVITLAAWLRVEGARVVALALENGPAWMIADLAVLAARLVCVPVPPFFSAAQQHHLLRDAGVDCILTDRPDSFAALQDARPRATGGEEVMLGEWRCVRLHIAPSGPRRLPPDTAKITYTSGTTGTPKGVCLRSSTLDTVARELAVACELQRADRHSSLLPLSTLLENVGLYAHLLAGGCCTLRPLTGIATAGAGLDGRCLLERLAEDDATTSILVPEMMRALVQAMEHGAARPPALRLLAVGGAPVSRRLLARAMSRGLPVYEGYGLSECGSVVALNTPRASKPGTVGRPLPHVALKFSATSEILVRGATFAGYVGEVGRSDEWHATGDCGHLDEDGYLQLTGRGKNIFITSYGRNVSPEWVESELTAQSAIGQAWVHGEARPWNVAVIAARAGATAAEIDGAIREANAALPEYARVQRWVAASAPFSTANGQLTANGRLRRDALVAAYGPLLQQLYTQDIHDVS